MVASDALHEDESGSLLETIIEKSPAGLILLERGRLLLANPAALLALGIDERVIGQPLRVDGPDGFLAERIVEALKTEDAAFDYRVPATELRSERILNFEVASLTDGRVVARVDDMTLPRRAEARWEEAVSRAIHDLKTPIAVLNLGLSNLSAYYDKLSDEDKKVELEDLTEQVRFMNEIMSDLFKQMKVISRKNNSAAEASQ